jgi:hypothetical protein
MPGYHAGAPPRNKGLRYTADPPTVDEIVAGMRHASDDRHGSRLRAMIVVLWRAGRRVQQALALTEHGPRPAARLDLGAQRQGWRRRRGRHGRAGLGAAAPWLAARAELPVGPLFCVIDGATRSRACSAAAVRTEFRRLAGPWRRPERRPRAPIRGSANLLAEGGICPIPHVTLNRRGLSLCEQNSGEVAARETPEIDEAQRHHACGLAPRCE